MSTLTPSLTLCWSVAWCQGQEASRWAGASAATAPPTGCFDAHKQWTCANYYCIAMTQLLESSRDVAASTVMLTMWFVIVPTDDQVR